MRRLLARLLAGLLMCAILAGCAGKQVRSDVREYLEEATGTTITSVRDPAAFMHQAPELAASGRDYVYFAPLLVSRGGERSFWLWLGVWSTVDRQARNESANPLRIGPIQILADGEPVELELQSADPNPAGIRRMPYATPATPSQVFMVPITRSQLERLSHARVLMLTDSPTDEPTRLWHGDDRATAVLSSFVDKTDAAGVGSGPRAAR